MTQPYQNAAWLAGALAAPITKPATVTGPDGEPLDAAELTRLMDAGWFVQHPTACQYIRPTTPAERLAHGRRFAVVTKEADGSLSYQYGEL